MGLHAPFLFLWKNRSTLSVCSIGQSVLHVKALWRFLQLQKAWPWWAGFTAPLERCCHCSPVLLKTFQHGSRLALGCEFLAIKSSKSWPHPFLPDLSFPFSHCRCKHLSMAQQFLSCLAAAFPSFIKESKPYIYSVLSTQQSVPRGSLVGFQCVSECRPGKAILKPMRMWNICDVKT